MRLRSRISALAALVITTSIATIAVEPSSAGAAPFTYKSVSTGYHRTCAVTLEGLGLCWGWNYAGSLGTTSTSSSVLTPSVVALPSGERFRSIEAGSYFTSCGLTESGNVYCWGEAAPLARVPLPTGSIVSQLSVGASQVCALTTEGALYCHGDWNSGELGTGDSEYTHLPVRVTLPDGATPSYVSAGIGFTCVVATSGAAYCSGVNAAGQLGNGGTTTSKVFTRVALPANVALTSISAGLERACALDTNGGGWCWGQNYNGALGDDTYAHSRIPRGVVLPADTALTDLRTGWYHTCAITTTGSALCWGSNDQGALGWGQTYGGKTIRTAALPDGVSAARLAIGLAGTCISSTDQRIFCWGSNLRGSVGTGSTAPAYSPTQVLTVGTPDPATPIIGSVSTQSTSLTGSFIPNGAASTVSLRISTSPDMANTRSVPVVIPRARQNDLPQLFAPVTFSTTVSDLRPATTYYVSTRATNLFGANDSAVAEFTTLGGAPTVGRTTTSNVGGDNATVHAMVDANLLDTSISVSFSNDESFTTNVVTVAGGTATGDSDTTIDIALDSLAPRTTYWARVTATNEVGSAEGHVVSFTTLGAPPSNLRVAAEGGRRSATVVADVDTGQLRTTVTVSHRIALSKGAWSTQQLIIGPDRTSATFSLTKLDPATTYDVVVRASNAAGSSPDSSATVTTLGGAPTVSNAESRDVGDTTATLRALVDSNDFATRVTLQIDTDESFGNYDEWFAGSLVAGSDTALSLDVSDLVDSTVYFARFVAKNAKGGTVGDIITFTTSTPVGKLLKRRNDPVDPTPIVVPTPTVIDQPVSLVASIVGPKTVVRTSASTRTTKQTAKAKQPKRKVVGKRSTAR